MNKFIVKAVFETTTDLKRVVSCLEETGLEESNIDYIQSGKVADKGFRVVPTTKGPELAFKYLTFGLIIGVITSTILYFYKFIDSSLQVYSLTILFIGIIVIIGFLFMGVGFLIGKKSSIHSLRYLEKPSGDESIVLAVNVNSKLLEKVKLIISNCEPLILDVIDVRREVEVGAREE